MEVEVVSVDYEFATWSVRHIEGVDRIARICYSMDVEYDWFRTQRGLILFWGGEAIGYICWTPTLYWLDDLRIALLPEFEELDLATHMLDEAWEMLEHMRRLGIRVYVDEEYLDAQLWFRDHGFLWDHTLEAGDGTDIYCLQRVVHAPSIVESADASISG